MSVKSGLMVLSAVVIAVLAVCVVGSASEGEYVVTMKAPKAAEAPAIDGDLTDSAWLDAALAGAKTSGFITHDGLAITQTQPVAFVTWDETYLYVAFRVFHAAPDQLVAAGTADGDPVWQGDDVELFIDANHDHLTHFQFALGHNNVKTVPTDASLDVSLIKTATSHDSRGWSAEIALPWSALSLEPEVGLVIGFNLNGHSINPIDQWFAWSPTFGAFAQPARFGHLELGPEYE